MLTVSVSGQLGTTLSVSNNELHIGVGQPTMRIEGLTVGGTA